MGRPSRYEELLAVYRQQLDAGREIDHAAAARAVGISSGRRCSRGTASNLYHHGLRPTATSPGALPLKEVLGQHRPKPAPAPDKILGRLCGVFNRGVDRADAIVRDPDSSPAQLDAAIKIAVSITGAVEKLRASGKRGLRTEPGEDEHDPPPAGATGQPAEEETEAERVAREARIAAALADEPDDDEPPTAEVSSKAAA